MRIARHVRVTGRVQGVFFRAWTREQARSLHVTGWVRNCSDGSVEAQLEGEAADVDELVHRLGKGPPDARVDRLDIRESKSEEIDGFEVRH